uniref:Uncharacterized protein n=1 Tax=Romanomermis culicivorax TaxID=13658 RepID=A0A915HYS7_ROMCU
MPRGTAFLVQLKRNFQTTHMTKFKISMCFYEGFYAWLRPTKKTWTSLSENALIGQKKEEYTCLDTCQTRKR